MENSKKIISNFRDYVEGGTCRLGKITRIYKFNDDYILYETNKQGDICYETADDLDAKCIKSIRSHVIKVQSILTTRKERRRFSTKISMAYADCFDGEADRGKKMLENLYETIKSYRKLKSKISYMASSLSFTVFNILICTLVNTIWYHSMNHHLSLLITIATFGSLGGLISIISKIPNMKLDIKGSNFLQIMDSFSRVFLSMISSVIIFAFIKSDLVLGALNNLDNNNVFYAFAVVSGFSEKFIPNIIKGIEKKNHK